MTRRAQLATLVFAWATLMAIPAAAQTAGVRAGVSVDPNQFYFGGHAETGPIVDLVHFRPNVEIGVGSDITFVALNLEFVYQFPSQQVWSFYAGAGPALNIINRDPGTDTEGGLNLLVGAQHRDGLFVEFKIGLLDSPDVKLGVGYQVRWR